MIISQQMQYSMDQKPEEFLVRRVAKGGGLRPGRRQANDDVTKNGVLLAFERHCRKG